MTGIFRKLLLTYLLIITLVIVALSLLFAQFFRAHFFNEKQSFLMDVGRYVNTLLLQYHRDTISKEELSKAVNNVGETANTRIIVIEGQQSTPDRQYLMRTLGIQEDQLIDSIERVFLGETIVRRRYFASQLGTYVIAVAVPMWSGGKVLGATVLFSPVYQIDRALAGVYRRIWHTALICLFAGSIVIWFIAKSLSAPIIKVSRTAEELAMGRAVQDISAAGSDEVGQLINSFNFMRKQLQRTEKMRSELIAGVSHELRTPLTAVRGFIQGILDGVVPEGDQARYLQLALQETNRLTRLVNDLLDLAKLESGGMSLKKEMLDISALIADVIKLLSQTAAQKGIEISLHSAGGATLFADSDRLRQVMFNLLSNAINYTAGGGQVEVLVSEDDSSVIVKVTDSGIGIPAEELPFIFDKFHRVDKSRDITLGGTGLGLAIVKSLVELHGGTIGVESTVGRGTAFNVVFPNN